MKTLKCKYGNTALVTGGSSGIGKAIAFELAKQGIKPILVARNQDKLNTTALEIFEKFNIRSQTFSVDLSNEKATKAFLKELDSYAIGILVHAAGIENNGGFTSISTEKELKLIKLNITSTYLLTNYFAKKMTEQKYGGILLVSSTGGLMPLPYFSNYAASKSYVHYLGMSLHSELKRKGIDVSVLAPGLTDTPMVADNGIDWSKLPFASQEPSEVATYALKYLGKKATIIPGFMNQVMVAMAKRVFTLKSFSLMNEWMVRKAISSEKLAPDNKKTVVTSETLQPVNLN